MELRQNLVRQRIR